MNNSNVSVRTVLASVIATLHTNFAKSATPHVTANVELLTGDDLSVLCARAVKALRAEEAAATEVAKLQFKAAIDDVIKAARADVAKAKKEYDNASPALRAMLPAFGETIKIPASSFFAAFGGKATTQEVMHQLATFGYKTNGRRGTPGGDAILVPFVVEVAAPPAAATSTDTSTEV